MIVSKLKFLKHILALGYKVATLVFRRALAGLGDEPRRQSGSGRCPHPTQPTILRTDRAQAGHQGSAGGRAAEFKSTFHKNR